MLILGVETTGQAGSLALAEAGPGGFRVLEVAPLQAGEYSAQLIPVLAAMLQRQGLQKSGISAIAAATGPGSFTGLRVGLAAVKALAEALQVPIAAVSFLEAVAAQGAAQAGELLALVDAGRDQVYCGSYAVEDGRLRCRSEQLLRRDEFSPPAGAVMVTPDESLNQALREGGLAVTVVARPDAGHIARLGGPKLERGETVTPSALEANYIRRSDAELFRPAGSRP